MQPLINDTQERDRISALHRYKILDTPPDRSFDNITRLAATLLEMPVAIVSLVDTDRIWYKSTHGLDVSEIERKPGLCASVILNNSPYVLSDASSDSRSLANPMVAGELGLRFYAAVPIQTHDKHNIGTLCVGDFKPRTISDDKIEVLKCLAKLVMDQLELQLSARHVDELCQETEYLNKSLKKITQQLFETNNLLQKKSDALQATVFYSRNFSTIATDQNGMIQFFNVGAETMLGYRAGEVVNIMTPADLCDKQELSARCDALIMEFGDTIHSGFETLIYKAAWGIEDVYELSYHCKNGSHLPVLLSVTALRDENNAIIGYLLIATDNTARKIAEQNRITAAKKLLLTQLKEASALQDAIFNSHNFSKIATDANGVIQIFNVGAQTMLGYSALDVLNIMTPADLSDADELIERADALSIEYEQHITAGFQALIYKAKQGLDDIYELTYLCKDGRRLPAIVSVTALRDKTHVIIGYLLISTDNSARKLVEQSKGIASPSFHSAMGMFIADAQGKFTLVNKAFEETCGYSKAELIGQPVNILKSGVQDSGFYKELWRDITLKGRWTGDIWNKRKNGDVYCEKMSIVKVLDKQSNEVSYVANFYDITQLKAYEGGLIEAKDKAERFSILKSEFMATMSHEIRTPMSAIIGFSSLALYEDMPDEVRAYLQDINTASTSLLGILQDILDFSKLEIGRVVIDPRPFNLNVVLDTISTLFMGAAQQKGLNFSIASQKTIPYELIGDKNRLQQVLINLVGNAIKFTAHGSVKLSVKLENLDPEQVRLLFTVTDTGIGIAHQDHDKLFLAFSQVDGSHSRKFGGSGLGLAISKELVELMGGEISVISHKGEGSAFSFILVFDRLNEDDMEYRNTTLNLHTQVKVIAHQNKLKGFTVLVVEDNDMSQKLIIKHLSHLGIDAKIAQHGEEALALLEQYDFDAVLMDIHMPIMNGIKATQLIHEQEQFAALPIIALSAGVSETERNNCIACGMVGFISKPIDEDQLYLVLELWLGKKQSNHARQARLILDG